MNENASSRGDTSVYTVLGDLLELMEQVNQDFQELKQKASPLLPDGPERVLSISESKESGPISPALGRAMQMKGQLKLLIITLEAFKNDLQV